MLADSQRRRSKRKRFAEQIILMEKYHRHFVIRWNGNFVKAIPNATLCDVDECLIYVKKFCQAYATSWTNLPVYLVNSQALKRCLLAN
jgi:hypothetical protein